MLTQQSVAAKLAARKESKCDQSTCSPDLVGAKGENRTVRVSHAGKLTPEEIAQIDKV